MKLYRLLCAVLSAALLIGLCACSTVDDPVYENPFGTRAPARPSSTSDPADPSETPSKAISTPEPTPEPTPSIYAQYDSSYRLDVPVPALIDGLEMPIVGATGYASANLPLYSSIPNRVVTTPEPAPSPSDPPPTESPDASEPPETEPTDSVEPTAARTSAPLSASAVSSYANTLDVLAPGTAFIILEESGGWWRVQLDKAGQSETGWIEHRYCLINLPDVIPSIIYDDANAYSSLFVSSGRSIPNVTGQPLDHTLLYNPRLGKQEFMMPILYAAARNICAAQHRALAEGNCLVIYQTFRSYEVQMTVVNNLRQLAITIPEVNDGINTPPWSIDWFIATGINNHQRGYALDASMVKVRKAEIRYIGSYPYLETTSYEDYEMPTAMHELSMAAASTVSPNSTQLSDTMTVPAIALRKYFTDSGLTPLASEWWHFNDNAAMRAAADNPSDGMYRVYHCYSVLPEQAQYLART